MANTHESVEVNRRTVAKGAAWTVPVVAIGVAAPAASASETGTCTANYGAPGATPNAWTPSSPNGVATSGSGGSRWTSTVKFEAVGDNPAWVGGSNANGTVNVSGTIGGLAAGASYTVNARINAGYANVSGSHSKSSGQWLQASIGGNEQSFTTRAGFGQGTLLIDQATGEAGGFSPEIAVPFTFTATGETAPVSLVFTTAPRQAQDRRDWGNDDIYLVFDTAVVCN